MLIPSLSSGFQISTGTVMAVIAIHFVADFVLQTQDQFTNTRFSNKYLAWHVFNYSITTSLGWFMLFPSGFSFSFIAQSPPGHFNLLWVFVITYLAHFTTDYCTSRWTKKLWEGKEVHDFFVAIGFDQFMHMVQLLYMYQFLLAS